MRTVFRNGVVFRGRHTAGFQTCNSIVIKDGLIEYIGDGVGDAADDGSNIIDLQGRVVLSSFIDAHVHLLQFGASLVKVSLDECKNLEDIRNTISRAARRMPNAACILCRGWRQSTTNREALASMLDDLDTRPIFIDADDLHSEWCNSAALHELGITKNTPDPIDGTIHRDKGRNPTGLLSEGVVISTVWPHLIGAMLKSEKLDCLRAAIKEYHAAGYTGVIEMAMDRGNWELLEELHRGQELGLRIAAHWIIMPKDSDEENLAQVQEAIEMHTKYNLENSPDFRIAGIKIICDGVIDSCTAALSEPYLVAPHANGELLWKPAALAKVASKADAANLQIALHAIGDAAIHLAIDTLENLGSTGRRHRIEHLEVTRPEDAKRLGRLGIIASVQPVHSDPSILGAWPELVGSERCDWAFAHGEFHENGAQLAIGTDAPTAPHMPFPNLYVANTRSSSRDPHNHSRINRRKGLDMHTVFDAASWGAAYSCFAEHLTGSLEVGKFADFIVLNGLSQNFNSKALLQAHVVETWLRGKRVYVR